MGFFALQPWAFQPHPEVWMLVVGVAVAYMYAVRVLGPAVLRKGLAPTTRRQRLCFVVGWLLLWGMSDWPIHDIAEKYLYSVHMIQHFGLSYFMPPLMLIAIPEWMARSIIGSGKIHRVFGFMTAPVFAGVAFNLSQIVTHIPTVVNASSGNALVHYSLHFVLVMTSVLMWMPLCGPLPEFRRKPGGQMLYLFLMSVVPTVPAAWLTFADKAVYKVYDRPFRLFGISVEHDQQIAGLIMKVFGSVFLWVLITVLFFKRFMPAGEENRTFRRLDDVNPASIDVVSADL
jgi:putative membrane protein